MKEIHREQLPNVTPEQIIEGLNQGAVIVNASLPFLKEIFGKIKELVQSIQTDNLSTPKGKRKAIEELQREVEILNAKDILQKEYNKLNDAAILSLSEKIQALENKA